jgi:hydrogenase accessory protein HypB
VSGVTFVLNLVASPGAGKMRTILATIEALSEEFRFGVLDADIDSEVDAELIAARGIPAVQLRTGGFCHLDASMVRTGFSGLDLDALDVAIIENVGNLVLPGAVRCRSCGDARARAAAESRHPNLRNVGDDGRRHQRLG